VCEWTHVGQTCVVQGSAVSLLIQNSEAHNTEVKIHIRKTARGMIQSWKDENRCQRSSETDVNSKNLDLGGSKGTRRERIFFL